MTLLQQLNRWRNVFRRQGDEPTFIPLTHEEISVVASECPHYGQTVNFLVDRPPKVFGHDVFSTEFAEDMRKRQISLPVIQLAESADIPIRLYESKGDCHYDNVLRRRLLANICSDTTRLSLTFEWDILAAFKRKLRLTRWFPVRTKTVRIDARVLYPYIKVSLPHNRSHTTLQHVT